jgi:hypothetical protein
MASPNLEGLSLQENEEEGFRFEFDEEGEEQTDLKWCLMGRFLCERPIHVKSMKVRMAEVWEAGERGQYKRCQARNFFIQFRSPFGYGGSVEWRPVVFR